MESPMIEAEQPPETASAEVETAFVPPAATALVIIDVQHGFDDSEWGKRNNPEAEGNIAQLLQWWRATRRPVFHIHHTSVIPDGHFKAGSAGQRVKAIAAPAAGEPVLNKTVNSAFIGTSLEADLHEKGIETVVLVGLTTNHCVSTTARMAANLGFRTLVVSDATAAFERAALDGSTRTAERVHCDALSDLQGEFAEITTTEMIVALLLRELSPPGAGSASESQAIPLPAVGS